MLIATGIMAIGLVMVATIFPVGVKLTALTTERTIAAVVADEAFAKIQLYGLRDFEFPDGSPKWVVLDPSIACSDFQYVTSYTGPDGFADNGDETVASYGANGSLGGGDDVYLTQYPSTPLPAGQRHNYHWSALCRRVGAKNVQVTVFVTRKIAAASLYRAWDYDPTVPDFVANAANPWPKPVPVNVQYNYNNQDPPPLRELVLDTTDTINAEWDSDLGQTDVVFRFFDEGYTIVNNRDGKIYRVLEMKDADDNGIRETIVLQQDWQWFGYDSNPLNPPITAQLETIWLVPPAAGSGRYPCVGVYQKVIRFDGIK